MWLGMLAIGAFGGAGLPAENHFLAAFQPIDQGGQLFEGNATAGVFPQVRCRVGEMEAAGELETDQRN